MINEEAKTEQIDRYLDNEMISTERADFEKRLRLDEELRLEVEAQNSIKAYIQQQAEKDDLKNLFDRFHTSDEAKKDDTSDLKEFVVIKPKWVGLSYWAIAASVALMIISTWIILEEKSPEIPSSQIRDGHQNIVMLKIPLLIWEKQKGVRVLKQTRFMDATITRDTIHLFHYRFIDKFELFLNRIPNPTPRINLQYDNNTKTYKAWIDGRPYAIQKTNTVMALQ